MDASRAASHTAYTVDAVVKDARAAARAQEEAYMQFAMVAAGQQSSVSNSLQISPNLQAENLPPLNARKSERTAGRARDKVLRTICH